MKTVKDKEIKRDKRYPGSMPCGCYPTYHVAKCPVKDHAEQAHRELRRTHYGEK